MVCFGNEVGIIPGLKPDFSSQVDLIPGMVLCFSIQQYRRSGMVLPTNPGSVIFPGMETPFVRFTRVPGKNRLHRAEILHILYL